jgi:hypothetical protein
MRSAAALLLPLLAACGVGRVDRVDGRDALETALFVQDVEGDGERAVIVLSNSALSCEMFTESDDPSEQTRADLALQAAFTREGALIVSLTLYRFTAAAPKWDGLYLLSDAAGHPLNTATSPRNAGAVLYEVLESEVDEASGLVITYTPTDVRRLDPVTGSGAVTITRSPEGALMGSFDLEDAQISGRFRAEDCGEVRDLFLTLDLLRGEDSPRGDTGA